MKYSLFILLAILSFICFADVYMQTDKNGNTTFSDAPMGADAKKIEAPEINTVSSPSSKTPAQNATAGGAQTVPTNQIIIGPVKKPYTTFIINSPANEETIQNQPSIPVNIKIEPNLQEGDIVQIYLDGAPWGNPAPTTHFQLTAPERGIHQISAKLMDKNGQVLKESPSNRIYVHQAALGGSPPRVGTGI